MSLVNLSSTTSSIPVTVGPPTNSDIELRFPATEAQLEVWLSSQQSVEASCAYNEISSLIIRGSLDPQSFRTALDQVVQRNSMLRSRFSADGQHVLVSRSNQYLFDTVDYSNLNETDQAKALGKVVCREGETNFDLVNGPLLRVVLQKLNDQHHVVTITAHHLVLDGWSLALFCRDLGYFYDANSDDKSGTERAPLPPADQYGQYAEKMEAYLNSQEGRADEAFWVNQYSDEIPVLDLPADGRRPSVRTYRAARTDFTLPIELIERARKVGAKQGCSLFNVMLAAFSSYIARISNQDNFCIGIPSSGQAAMEQPELIGHCVNTMPYRSRVDVQQSFSDQLKATRNNLLDAMDHQRYSYGTLLRKLAPPRDPSRPPMLSLSFNLDPVIDTSEMGFSGLDVNVQIEPRRFEHFEWFINGVIHRDQSIEFQIQHNTDLYSCETMAYLAEGFTTFLECLVTAPEASLDSHHLMSIAQRQQMIVDWNETTLDYPTQSTLHDEFSRQAKATPNEIAVVFEDVKLSYGEVEQRANQIANFLRTQNVSQGDLVGICVERSERMLVYLYGILKSGAGYVPLDPAYPSDRLQYMCDHSGLRLIVTEETLTERVSEFNKPMLAIDKLASEIDQCSIDAPEKSADPTDVCYVIYTSGSTGKPKGVQVPHGAVVNFLYSMQETPGFTSTDSVLAVTTLSFDIAVLELYLPTISGGRVVIVDSMTAADGDRLGQALIEHDISVLQATPATWRLMIQAGWSGKSDLKVLCGGEPMPKDLVQPLLDRCQEQWNMYGPTETTVWSAAFQIESAAAPILIGKPIGNTQIYILDQNGNEVPVGCEGEVFIGGAGVTLGYRNRDDLTSERFVENRYRNPFTHYVSDQLYKTGDLARFRRDGNIEFLRRNDKQVKVRGFRIELGEIESALDGCPKIEQNVVVVREDQVGDARLVAYFVPKAGDEVDANELRDRVRQSLPYYMVPQHFVALASFPQTNNGKIDYKALPAPSSDGNDSVDIVEPETPAQVYLANIWKGILETDEVDLNDTFFDIGGHSLLVMKVIAQVADETGMKLGPQDFLVGTLEQLAEQISNAEMFVNSKNRPVESTESNSNEEAAAQQLNASQSVAAESNEDAQPESNDPQTGQASTTVSPKNEPSQGVFKKLRGFWN